MRWRSPAVVWPSWRHMSTVRPVDSTHGEWATHRPFWPVAPTRCSSTDGTWPTASASSSIRRPSWATPIVHRRFPWIDADADPWSTLLTAEGRIGGEHWIPLEVPLDERDGAV